MEILLVEDDAGDIDLTKEALEESKLQVNLNIVRDGVEAIAYLRREGEYTQATRPDLILLDLNLPRLNGHEVLQEIKNDDKLKAIPIVVLSTSDTHEDIRSSYNLGANCYIKKTLDMDKFIEIVRSIENFWFSIVQLPHQNSQ
jgi:CheY-like chemotaxis protein